MKQKTYHFLPVRRGRGGIPTQDNVIPSAVDVEVDRGDSVISVFPSGGDQPIPSNMPDMSVSYNHYVRGIKQRRKLVNSSTIVVVIRHPRERDVTERGDQLSRPYITAMSKLTQRRWDPSRYWRQGRRGSVHRDPAKAISVVPCRV